MSQIIEKPEGYISHRLQAYGNNTILLIMTEDNDKPIKEVVGDEYDQFEVREEENDLVIEEIG